MQRIHSIDKYSNSQNKTNPDETETWPVRFRGNWSEVGRSEHNQEITSFRVVRVCARSGCLVTLRVISGLGSFRFPLSRDGLHFTLRETTSDQVRTSEIK